MILFNLFNKFSIKPTLIQYPLYQICSQLNDKGDMLLMSFILILEMLVIYCMLTFKNVSAIL
jgi:hypothetical protein